ncbi:DUF4176 domain-containing protein [Streptococcus marimammalium]|uniref:DUF4176 domain-containing protein n=1 Tax=Streptococcus marimammalium TaxID=269666 RepID=UPI000363AAF9|nr:DUF4176 domain-containing protein [Streptococcus marimammalium]
MSNASLLPIGSIVILKGNTKKMMITSRIIAAPIKGEVYRFDYGACLYPEGLMGENLIFFNNEDILRTVHEGFSDEENEIMLENIESTLSETTIPKGKVADLVDANQSLNL